MNILKEIAIARMKELNISPAVIEGFKKGKIYKPIYDGKAFTNVEVEVNLKKTIRQLEKDYSIRIYYCMPVIFNGITVYAFLFVAKCRDINTCSNCLYDGSERCDTCDKNWRVMKNSLYSLVFNDECLDLFKFGFVRTMQINGTLVWVL